MTAEIKAMIAGLCFGLWPLFMNQSGLTGKISSAVFAFLVFAIVAPFAFADGMSKIVEANWIMAIAAGIFGAIGILSFNGMLAQTRPQDVGAMFIIMILVQTAVPAVHQMIMNGVTPSKAVGILLALVAAVLLSR